MPGQSSRRIVQVRSEKTSCRVWRFKCPVGPGCESGHETSFQPVGHPRGRLRLRLRVESFSLEISQYPHNTWTVRDGFFKWAIHTIAQTTDGYLWLGTEFGLFRLDGVRSSGWRPPEGQHLPGTDVYALLAARDGALLDWTFNGR